MKALDMSAAAVSRRIQLVSEDLDLAQARRLDTKIDLSPAAISRRLREVSELNTLCQNLRAKR